MELESMFTDQKWNILKCLSEDKFSPLQLSKKLDTTMANISQQLRLLEATNLVKKEKIKNRDRGKPRTLFSLNNDCAYLISAMGSFADKKLLKVNEHHKVILRIWFLKDIDAQYDIEKIYWNLRSKLSDISAIIWNNKEEKLLIYADNINHIKSCIKDVSTSIKVDIKKLSPRMDFHNTESDVIYNSRIKSKRGDTA